jgi:hypothetical protein
MNSSLPRSATCRIRCALRGLAAWTAYLLAADVPVLAETATTLEALRANQAAVDAHLLTEAIYGDPPMTLKVLEPRRSRPLSC